MTGSRRSGRQKQGSQTNPPEEQPPQENSLEPPPKKQTRKSVLPLDPTEKANWPKQPTSAEELDIWINQTRDALLKWLQDIGAMEQNFTVSELAKRAASAWEDFLYYQNVWNRKGYDPYKVFFETDMERMIHYPNESLSWQDNMIKLYNEHKLAYRKRMPKIIDPEIAHRYSQPPRGTINIASELGKQRFDHLELKFPRKRRKELNEEEKEGTFRASKEEKEQMEKCASGEEEWEPISLHLDEEAFRKLQREKDKKFLEDPLTQALLPENHKLHHGCMERSTDWPTSFDSPSWGNQIAITIVKPEYVFEKIQSTKDSSDNEDNYRRDENGDKIIKIIPATFKKVIEYKEEKVRIPKRGRDGSKLWDKEKEKFRFEKDMKTKKVEVLTDRLETDQKGNPIQITPAYKCFRNKFQVHNVLIEDLPDIGKQEIRRNKPGAKEEFSDFDEDEDDEDDEENEEDEDRTESDAEAGSDDEDDGDIFRSAYKEASFEFCARWLLRRLETANKSTPLLTVDKIISLMKDGTSWEEIEEECQLWSQ